MSLKAPPSPTRKRVDLRSRPSSKLSQASTSSTRTGSTGSTKAATTSSSKTANPLSKKVVAAKPKMPLADRKAKPETKKPTQGKGSTGSKAGSIKTPRDLEEKPPERKHCPYGCQTCTHAITATEYVETKTTPAEASPPASVADPQTSEHAGSDKTDKENPVKKKVTISQSIQTQTYDDATQESEEKPSTQKSESKGTKKADEAPGAVAAEEEEKKKTPLLEIDKTFSLQFGMSDFCITPEDHIVGLIFVKRAISTFDREGNKLSQIVPSIKKFPILKIPSKIFRLPSGNYIVIDGKMGKFMTIVSPNKDGTSMKSVPLEYKCSDLTILDKSTLAAVHMLEAEVALIDIKTGLIKSVVKTDAVGMYEPCYVACSKSGRHIIILSKDCDIRVVSPKGKLIAYLSDEHRDNAFIELGKTEALAACFDESENVYIAVRVEDYRYRVLVFNSQLEFLGIGVDDIQQKITKICVTSGGEFLLGDSDSVVRRYSVPPLDDIEVES